MLQNGRSIYLLLTLFLSADIAATCSLYAQEIRAEVQDTTMHDRRVYLQHPDTINRQLINSLKKGQLGSAISDYIDFMILINDTAKYIITPLNSFNVTINPKKVVIGLRHDVDLDLNIAFKLATVEKNFGIRSSYYILHTAGYYLENPMNMAVHTESIISPLKIMQNDYHHEIGWHNDLVTLQLVYNIDPVNFLHHELDWLRKKGLNISGTASHGSMYCYTFNYLNFYFFKEYKNQVSGQFVNNDSAFINEKWVKIKHGTLKEFDLDYEAYFLNNNKYYSDTRFINGIRWSVSRLDLNSLSPGDRVIILMHPVYYQPSGSSDADITSFSLPGQVRSSIDAYNATIQVEMPVIARLSNLISSFSLSSGARAMTGHKEMHSDLDTIDFTNPVNIRVISEDGLTSKNWLVTVVNAGCSLSVSLNRIRMGAQRKSSTSFSIISNIPWSIYSSEEWLTTSLENGTGNQTIMLTARPNTATSERSAFIKVSGENAADQYISVIQDAAKTGIQHISDSAISVYPNPASRVLFIKGVSQNSTISISGITGKIMMKKQLIDNMIDISNLENGLYTLTITYKRISRTIRFIKE